MRNKQLLIALPVNRSKQLCGSSSFALTKIPEVFLSLSLRYYSDQFLCSDISYLLKTVHIVGTLCSLIQVKRNLTCIETYESEICRRYNTVSYFCVHFYVSYYHHYCLVNGG